MGSSFEVVGVLLIASSRRSLKIELNDLPFTTFKHDAYVSIKDVEDLLRGRKKTATIWMRKGDQANESCEAYRS